MNHLQVHQQICEAAGDGPFTDDDLAQRLFGSKGAAEVAAARGLLRGLILARDVRAEAPLPFRVHYFFHNAGRIWACLIPRALVERSRQDLTFLPSDGCIRNRGRAAMRAILV
jgi:hypothetical protein